MAKDLRTFLRDWNKRYPDDIVRVKKKVKPNYEIPAIQLALEEESKFPGLIFEETENLYGQRSRFPIITNLFASRLRCAESIDIHPRRVAVEYTGKESQLVEPVVVNKRAAPVKEVVMQGNQVDLFQFPVVTHHEMDSAPFITAGVVTTKDPDSGEYNLALQRLEIKDKNRTGVWISPGSHNGHILRKYEQAGKPMPCVVTIGHHPAFAMGAQSKIALDVGEHKVIGALLGEPLELIPSETWGEDFLVPARAELVIEGLVPPGVREVEAPFGEFTRYYGAQRYSSVLDVTAITHRKDAYYHDILVSHADNLVMGGFALEAKIYRMVKEAVPSVLNVHLPLSGCCRFIAYVQIRNELVGNSKDALALALPANHVTKHAIVVDEDIDIFDDREVLWAIATRSQWDKDVVILRGMKGAELDPSIMDGDTAKGGIDATMPPPPTPYEKKVDLPAEVVKATDLKKLLGAQLLRKITPETW